LDQLKEEINNLNKKYKKFFINNNLSQQQQQQQQSEHQMEQKHDPLLMFNNPAIDNFQFEITHSIQCNR
jgi:hypothetical protein